MAVRYKIVPKKNPQKLDDPPKYYAQVVVSGKDSTQALAKEIAQNTTLGRADIIGVLTALGEIVATHLAMGRSVDLLDLCILSPSISSAGANSEEEFNANTHIKKVGVKIRPKRSLVDVVQKAGVERV